VWTLQSGGNCFILNGGTLKCDDVIISEYDISNMKFIECDNSVNNVLRFTNIQILKANMTNTGSPAINLNISKSEIIDSVCFILFILFIF
jgi:hypothetical protein